MRLADKALRGITFRREMKPSRVAILSKKFLVQHA
jgi:hypothetical protein